VYPSFLTGSIEGRDYNTNAWIHSDACAAITEDISNFFPSITSEAVYEIWNKFFGFAHEPSMLLTSLTTRDGVVFQGTPTSSYIANLAFWDVEHIFVNKLLGRGLRYSRYVDDITVSSFKAINLEDKKWAIAQIYAMAGSKGFNAKREKHFIFNGSRPIEIMGLVINSGVSLPHTERANIRAAVRSLENQNQGFTDLTFRIKRNHVLGKIGKLKRFHGVEADKLRARLDAIAQTKHITHFNNRKVCVDNKKSSDLDDKTDTPF
jgi:hypothetical protein